jgi:hypothetical protein
MFEHGVPVLELRSVKDDELLVQWNVCDEYAEQAGSMRVMSDLNMVRPSSSCFLSKMMRCCWQSICRAGRRMVCVTGRTGHGVADIALMFHGKGVMLV